MEDFEPYFDGKRKLLPRPSDLSFYNWDTAASTSNSSPNFQVLADNDAGLLFKNKRDRKVRAVWWRISDSAPPSELAPSHRRACLCPGTSPLHGPPPRPNHAAAQVINVDPRASPGDNTTRTEIRTGEYLQCVIYDHFTRRKG